MRYEEDEKMLLSDIVVEENKKDTLFLFYADLTDKCADINDSRAVQLLRDDFKFELLLGNFSLSEQLRLRNIKNELDRYVKLINMLILKYVLNNYEQEGVIEQYKESKNEYGKPRIENRKYQYNISDEVGIVCLAIGFNEDLNDSEVGIDLANPDDIERFELPNLKNFYRVDFKSIFGPDEIRELDQSFGDLSFEKRLQRLSQMWALKESYCKYLGLGITAGMENFQYPQPGDPLVINERITENHNSNFEVVTQNVQMKRFEGFDVPNGCFQFPDSKLICSVFGHYRNLCLVKINIEYIIKEFTR